MADFLTPENRSAMMSNVRSKDTGIEKMIRSLLHRQGYKFRKNVKRLPGRPDIVLPKYNSVIFVNGCFWHGHKGCPKSKLPATRTEFWSEKIKANILRDKNNIRKLQKLNWRVAVVWECALKRKQSRDSNIGRLIKWISSDAAEFELHG